jgi:hypothetical protein
MLHDANPARALIAFLSLPGRGNLDGGLRVLEKHLEVGLVPLTGLRRGLEGILLAAEGVVAGSTRVAGAVGLAARLDPDEGVSVGGSRDGAGRTRTEASVDHVAPVTPLKTTSRVATAASVDDGMAGHAGSLESGSEEVEVLLLVLSLVVLSIGVAGEFTRLSVPVGT